MKIIFFGTDRFAKEMLLSLFEKGFDIIAVVTKRDKPKGRGKQLSPSPVKELCLEKNFLENLHQPEKVSSKESIDCLQRYRADLFVVVSYGQILQKSLLDLPLFGAINVHPSLLPKYRGPSPIQSALIAGEKKTGVTLIAMDETMDGGGIVQKREVEIPLTMSFGELEQVLCDVAKTLLEKALEEIERGKKIQAVPQEEVFATYTKKIKTEDSFISWDSSSWDVYNFIRAMNPRPGARWFFQIRGQKILLKVFSSKMVFLDSEKRPGEVLFFSLQEGFVVACKKGAISLLDVQQEGKKRVSVKEFLNGFFSILKGV